MCNFWHNDDELFCEKKRVQWATEYLYAFFWSTFFSSYYKCVHRFRTVQCWLLNHTILRTSSKKHYTVMPLRRTQLLFICTTVYISVLRIHMVYHQVVKKHKFNPKVRTSCSCQLVSYNRKLYFFIDCFDSYENKVVKKLAFLFLRCVTFRQKGSAQPSIINIWFCVWIYQLRKAGGFLGSQWNYLCVRVNTTVISYQSCGSGAGSIITDPAPDPSVHHQAKIVRKTLIATVLWLLYDFLTLKKYANAA